MNKKCVMFVFPAMVLLASSCASLNKKIVFQPVPEQTAPSESVRITETQNVNIPEWVIYFLNGGIRQVEAMVPYKDSYVFVGKNSGTNFNALRQWANGFNTAQDFPRLAATRIEKRLLAGAELYPDDEYGEYFEALVKDASIAEYPPALREDTYWIKRWMKNESNTEAADLETESASHEIYEFFVLITINKNILQARITDLLAKVKTTVKPSWAQSSAINRVRQNFFEGF